MKASSSTSTAAALLAMWTDSMCPRDRPLGGNAALSKDTAGFGQFSPTWVNFVPCGFLQLSPSPRTPLSPSHAEPHTRTTTLWHPRRHVGNGPALPGHWNHVASWNLSETSPAGCVRGAAASWLLHTSAQGNAPCTGALGHRGMRAASCI